MWIVAGMPSDVSDDVLFGLWWMQDVVFVEHRRPWPGRIDESFQANWSVEKDDTFHHHSCSSCGHPTSEFSLFCVFDGHNGKHAAVMCGDMVLSIVESLLPRGNPPSASHPHYCEWRHLLQRALALAMVQLNSEFALKGIHAGCTATIVLVTDWLVTCVNLGDSHAMLDTGTQLISLTADHRVAADKKERRRVEMTGSIVAPVSMSGAGPADDYSSGMGPLRVWPGGLSIARAIGDFDVGPSIVPFGHVVQVAVPTRGARLLVGSDGIWDAFNKKKRPGSMTRNWETNTVPSKMIQSIVKIYGQVKDDTSLIVVDIMPKDTLFTDVIASIGNKKSLKIEGVGSMKSDSSGSLCFCFGSSSGSKSGPLSKAAQKDDSVRSSTSVGSYLDLENNHTTATILTDSDLTEALDLVPERSLNFEVPEWLSLELKQQMLEAATEAFDTWMDASGRKPKVSAPAHNASKVSFAPDCRDSPKRVQEKTNFTRSVSTHFENSIAESTDDYAAKFGHYNNQFATTFGEQSVRAGRVYNTEASVHAGKIALMKDTSDPSVRLRGSDIEGSVHLKTRELCKLDIPDAVKESDDSSETAKEKGSGPSLAPVRTVKRQGSSVGS